MKNLINIFTLVLIFNLSAYGQDETGILIADVDKLFGYTDAQISALNAELLILIEYYEDAFAQNVYQMHSYSFKDLKGGSKFVAAYYFDENGQAVLDHGKLSIIESI